MKKLLIAVLAAAGFVYAGRAYEDEYVSIEGQVTVKDLGGDRVYIFTDTAAAATMTAKQPFTISEALVVGAGGGGGAVLGGGGGGGQVLATNLNLAVAADATIVATVGAGGSINGYNGGNNGGHSSLVIAGGAPIIAYGGGGGGGFSSNKSGRPAAVAGEIGSGGGGELNTASGSTLGTYYQFGNRGGSNQGGGGGAAGPGENGLIRTTVYGAETVTRKQAGYGGEGLTNAITGIGEVYGSGGGGGGGNSCDSQFNSPGGRNAGSGGTKTNVSPALTPSHNATAAVNGFGGGGGAGAFSNTGGSSSGGAATPGGSGTVIVKLAVGSGDYFKVWPVERKYHYALPAVEPKPVVTDGRTGATLVEGTDYTLAYDGNDVPPSTASTNLTITVTGKSGTIYDGYSETIRFEFVRNDFVVADIADQFWFGSDAEPELRVVTVENGVELTPGTDYTIEWTNNGRPNSGPVTATATVAGKAGTKYEGFSVSKTFKVHPPTFRFEDIPAVLYFGEPQTPAVTVVRVYDQEEIAEGDDFILTYENNNAVGTGRAVATGRTGTPYEGYSATKDFTINQAQEDEYFFMSSLDYERKAINGRITYIFTNAAAAEIAFKLKGTVTVYEMLAVGGGGGGGCTIGGGGGAGLVFHNDERTVFEAGTLGSVKVGAAGAKAATAGVKGGNGGLSRLAIGSVLYDAWGGGGGGSWSSTASAAAAFPNEIGNGGGSANGASIGTAGTNWNSEYGRAPSASSGSVGGNGGSASGTGIACAITGTEITYGVGGLGGNRSSGVAGADAAVYTGNGGQGGGYVGNNNWPGGNGGSGIVAISFKPGNLVDYAYAIAPIPDQTYLGSAVEPTLFVTNLKTQVEMVKGTDYEVVWENNEAAWHRDRDRERQDRHELRGLLGAARLHDSPGLLRDRADCGPAVPGSTGDAGADGDQSLQWRDPVRGGLRYRLGEQRPAGRRHGDGHRQCRELLSGTFRVAELQCARNVFR